LRSLRLPELQTSEKSESPDREEEGWSNLIFVRCYIK